MYQQSSYAAAPLQRAPAPQPQLGAPTWQWAPEIVGHDHPAVAGHVPPMRVRDGVAGLAIGLCILATALSAGIGFTVRETRSASEGAPAASGAAVAGGGADAAAAGKPLAADGHAHDH